ncbi:hypothetical protein Arub01_53010 [Actinomadura rubrobrunea]|uniref:Uncharacterized protein n=1 Tax=Actinomadura rubrobrunea TaxID=115335 RepID=A0A9W6Q249_9ACTN|nr:hypothetical protein Arub01_53010 [Actinomadura rubrobrunea]
MDGDDGVVPGAVGGREHGHGGAFASFADRVQQAIRRVPLRTDEHVAERPHRHAVRSPAEKRRGVAVELNYFPRRIQADYQIPGGGLHWSIM